MARFNHIFKTDYDKCISLGRASVFCYSKSKLQELYPDGYNLCGEVVKRNKKSLERFEKKQLKLRLKGKQEKELAKLGDLFVDANVLSIYPHGSASDLLHKTEGYVCVGDGQFIAVKTSRLAFLLILLGLILATVACIVLLLLPNDKPPVIIEPDHPLPPVDENVVPTPDDGGEKPNTPEGGGAVTMIYTLEATVTLSSGEIGIYVKNPKASSHDIDIKMYIISGNKEYHIASSGLVKAGNGLYKLTLKDDAPILKEGVYNGYYKLGYYDPVTGVRALVEADIKDVKITVNN